MKKDIYRDNKVYHLADLVNKNGGVSALCYKKPRAINLSQALWTINKDLVTCKKCLKKLSQSNCSTTEKLTN